MSVMTNNNQERKFKFEKIKENKEINNQRIKLIQKKLSKENKFADLLYSNSNKNLNDSRLDILGNESSSIKMSLKMSEELIKGNLELNDEIDNQNYILKNTEGKIDLILTKFPILNKVLGSIKFHKYKEKFILGFLIGVIFFIGLNLIYNKR